MPHGILGENDEKLAMRAVTPKFASEKN